MLAVCLGLHPSTGSALRQAQGEVSLVREFRRLAFPLLFRGIHLPGFDGDTRAGDGHHGRAVVRRKSLAWTYPLLAAFLSRTGGPHRPACAGHFPRERGKTHYRWRVASLPRLRGRCPAGRRGRTH